MFPYRTDLAVERHARAAKDTPSIPGLRIEQEKLGDAERTLIEITSKEASEALQKPYGIYITLDLRQKWQQDESLILDMAHRLARELRPLIPKEGPVLVVGLGNRMVTADALGPQALDKVIVTRHLHSRLPGLFDDFRPVTAVIPGVMGRTGLEPIEIIAGAAARVKPVCILAVDALAASSMDRLGCSFQIATCGIVPGEGAGGKREGLNEETLGAPVIAIGVPTVVGAATLAHDLLGVNDLPKNLDDSFLVTPGDIDLLIGKSARAIGYGIDLALLGDLPVSDLEQLLA